MGYKTTTTWTCDRCGVKVVLDECEQPNTWTHWYFRTPPNALSEKEESAGILCNECGGLAVEFIHSKDEQTVKRAHDVSKMMRQIHRLGDVRDGAVVLDEDMAHDALMVVQRIDASQYQRVAKRLREQLKESKGE